MAVELSLQKQIATRLAVISSQIEKSCQKAGRSAEGVRLISVSKRFPKEAIEAAYEAGLRHFGENYIQECSEKIQSCAHLPNMTWHFIGHLQSNKIKHLIFPNVQIDSVDNLRHASIIDRLAKEKNLRFPILIQVNLADEKQKSGCRESELAEMVSGIQKLPCVDLRGLMMIAPNHSDTELNRPLFKKLTQLTQYFNLQETSMGMSQDYTQAIEEGATMVRVGTALFGPRPNQPQ